MVEGSRFQGTLASQWTTVYIYIRYNSKWPSSNKAYFEIQYLIFIKMELKITGPMISTINHLNSFLKVLFFNITVDIRHFGKRIMNYDATETSLIRADLRFEEFYEFGIFLLIFKVQRLSSKC